MFLNPRSYSELTRVQANAYDLVNILLLMYSCRYTPTPFTQGQMKIAIILPKNRNTAIFNRLYIRLYIKFVANNGKNRDFAHAAIFFCPCFHLENEGMTSVIYLNLADESLTSESKPHTHDPRNIVYEKGSSRQN